MPTLAVRLTGYWPFQSGLSAAGRAMEGGQHDRMGQSLYTLEAYQRGEAPYVSVSGDYNAWPYGQRIDIDAYPGVVFRIVDTGSHFVGPGKVYRDSAREPLDICVETSKTPITTRASAIVYEGDVLPLSVKDKKHAGSEIDWSFVRGLDGDVTEETDAAMLDALSEVLDDGGTVALLAVAFVGALLALKGI